MKIEIELDEYISLRKSELKLGFLECGGVDNWSWYGDAVEPVGEPSLDDEIDELVSEIKKEYSSK